MTTWNYRLVDTGTDDQPEVALYEVYYDEDGAPVARTLHPTTVVGDDDDEARVALAHAARALAADTLKDSEIGGTV